MTRYIACKLKQNIANAALSPALFAEFQLFAEYAGASYCANDDDSTGDDITCADDVCPLVAAAGAVSVLEFDS